jgi:hypothetical protein
LKHGADPNVLVGSYTPLSYAEANLSAIPTTPEAGRAKSQWEQIVKALRDGGANPFLRRFSGITYTRPNWTREDVTIFSRGTNDYNRYTLFEFLAALFAANNAPAFPDFAHVTVERIEATNAKPREMAINVDELLRANDCSKDIWLEWGDRVSFPELDHPLNEQWPGLARETTDLIVRCLTRRVRIIVKQETNTVKLIQSMSSGARVTVGGGFPAVRIGTVGEVVAISDDTATPREKPEKTLYTFRLKEVVYGANVLRASSDPKRVRVSRLDRATNKNNEWLIDLTKVATAGEGNSSSTAAGKLGTGHDLWLRDGDVIEIPEKQ